MKYRLNTLSSTRWGELCYHYLWGCCNLGNYQTSIDELVPLKTCRWALVVHTFNPSTWEDRERQVISISLVYRVFQDNQGYTVKPFLGKQAKNKTQICQHPP